MAERKAFLLRVDPALLEAIQRWANDDLRSLNAQIEFLLRRALQEAGRGRSRDLANAKLEPLDGYGAGAEGHDAVGDEPAEGRPIEGGRRGGRQERLAGPCHVLAQLRGQVHLEAEHVVLEIQDVAAADAVAEGETLVLGLAAIERRRQASTASTPRQAALTSSKRRSRLSPSTLTISPPAAAIFGAATETQPLEEHEEMEDAVLRPCAP